MKLRSLITEKIHNITAMLGNSKTRITVKTFEDGTIMLVQVWNGRENRIHMSKDHLEQLKSLNL